MNICTGREAKVQATSAAIVTAAVQLVWERQSIDAVSVDDIAAEAGVSRRTFFNHFPGKVTAILHPLFDLRSHYVRAIVDAPRELAPWPAIRHGLLETLGEPHDLGLAARAEDILTHLVHQSTTGEVPSRDADDAHSRVLLANLESRLDEPDPVAAALLLGLGDQLLRVALRATLRGASAADTAAHACDSLHLLIGARA